HLRTVVQTRGIRVSSIPPRHPPEIPMHCRRFRPAALTRRDMLLQAANGFGALALASLLGEEGRADTAPRSTGLHHPAKAKSVIFLFMDGGPSQLDTFDPKPRLDREHGQPIKTKVQPTQFNNVGTVLKSPWKFRNRGRCGLPVSDLFPRVAE